MARLQPEGHQGHPGRPAGRGGELICFNNDNINDSLLYIYIYTHIHNSVIL